MLILIDPLVPIKGYLIVPIAILYREELKEYDFGPGHPFRGDRYEVFPPFLKKTLSEDDYYRILQADYAAEEDLLKICDKEYIDFSRDYYHAAHFGWTSYYERFREFQSLDNKPYGSPGDIEKAARLVVGQAKLACDLVLSGHYKKVVSIGGGLHHAKRNFGEGFCIYNDVAFAAIYLIEKYHLERILVLDTDAHAGNGTISYFYNSPNVLFIDTHQDPRTIYPGNGFASEIGEGEGKGFKVNIPMPLYSGFDSYKLVFEEIIKPVAREFKPQIIIRNGGSDPHFNDGLTSLALPISGFKMVGEQVREMAEACDGKLIDLIASGYNKTVLPYAWMSLIAGIASFPVEVGEPEPVPSKFLKDNALEETKLVIEEVKRNLKDYWQCLRNS